MKMQKFVIFVKTKFKINFEDKVSEHCHYTGEYRNATNSICNSKRSVLKESPTVFRRYLTVINIYHERVSLRI